MLLGIALKMSRKMQVLMQKSSCSTLPFGTPNAQIVNRSPRWKVQLSLRMKRTMLRLYKPLRMICHSSGSARTRAEGSSSGQLARGLMDNKGPRKKDRSPTDAMSSARTAPAKPSGDKPGSICRHVSATPFMVISPV
jgi:hypothetical protein